MHRKAGRQFGFLRNAAVAVNDREIVDPENVRRLLTHALANVPFRLERAYYFPRLEAMELVVCILLVLNQELFSDHHVSCADRIGLSSHAEIRHRLHAFSPQRFQRSRHALFPYEFVAHRKFSNGYRILRGCAVGSRPCTEYIVSKFLLIHVLLDWISARPIPDVHRNNHGQPVEQAVATGVLSNATFELPAGFSDESIFFFLIYAKSFIHGGATASLEAF